MATECRRTKRVNKQRLVRLLTVIAVSIATAFTIGRLTAPTKTDTVTVTKTVEVPVYSTDKLPETSDIFYFDVPLSHSLQRYIYEICADENVPVCLWGRVLHPLLPGTAQYYGRCFVEGIVYERTH